MPVQPGRQDDRPVERDSRGRFLPGNRVARSAGVVRMIAGADGTAEDAVRAALERSDGRVAEAARALCLYDHAHLWYYLRLFGMGSLPRELRERARRRLSGAA